MEAKVQTRKCVKELGQVTTKLPPFSLVIYKPVWFIAWASPLCHTLRPIDNQTWFQTKSVENPNKVADALLCQHVICRLIDNLMHIAIREIDSPYRELSHTLLELW